MPALFHELAKRGYDIWLYSAKYYSTDYIQNLFRHYHVRVDGVMTAIGKRAKGGENGKKLESMISGKYRYTLHIDNDMVLQIFVGTKAFREFELRGGAADWPQAVMDALERVEHVEGENAP